VVEAVRELGKKSAASHEEAALFQIRDT